MTSEVMEGLILFNTIVSVFFIIVFIIVIAAEYSGGGNPEIYAPHHLFKLISFNTEDIECIQNDLKNIKEQIKTLDVTVSILEENQEKEVIEE